jgi:hypothetical protein
MLLNSGCQSSLPLSTSCLASPARPHAGDQDTNPSAAAEITPTHSPAAVAQSPWGTGGGRFSLIRHGCFSRDVAAAQVSELVRRQCTSALGSV